MMMPKWTILVLGLVLVVAFQNCGNDMKFEQAGSLVAKADEDVNGDGVPDDSTGDDNTDNTDSDDDYDGGLNPGDGQPPRTSPTPAPSPNPYPSPSPTPRASPSPSPSPSPGYRPPGNRHDDKDDKDCKDKNPGHGGGHSSDSSYLCILEGPGKSVKLNYVTESGAYADESASHAACMSKHACLNIASQAFDVKLAERRGFCKTAAAKSGRVHLTDKQVEEAVAKVKLMQMLQKD